MGVPSPPCDNCSAEAAEVAEVYDHIECLGFLGSIPPGVVGCEATFTYDPSTDAFICNVTFFSDQGDAYPMSCYDVPVEAEFGSGTSLTPCKIMEKKNKKKMKMHLDVMSVGVKW